MRHSKGVWNGIWSDMYIESTFILWGTDMVPVGSLDSHWSQSLSRSVHTACTFATAFCTASQTWKTITSMRWQDTKKSIQLEFDRMQRPCEHHGKTGVMHQSIWSDWECSFYHQHRNGQDGIWKGECSQVRGDWKRIDEQVCCQLAGWLQFCDRWIVVCRSSSTARLFSVPPYSGGSPL